MSGTSSKIIQTRTKVSGLDDTNLELFGQLHLLCVLLLSMVQTHLYVCFSWSAVCSFTCDLRILRSAEALSSMFDSSCRSIPKAHKQNSESAFTITKCPIRTYLQHVTQLTCLHVVQGVLHKVSPRHKEQ